MLPVAKIKEPETKSDTWGNDVCPVLWEVYKSIQALQPDLLAAQQTYADAATSILGFF